MACWSRREALKHYMHKIVMASYGKGDSVTIECETCDEVLVAFEDLEPKRKRGR